MFKPAYNMLWTVIARDVERRAESSSGSSTGGTSGDDSGNGSDGIQIHVADNTGGGSEGRGVPDDPSRTGKYIGADGKKLAMEDFLYVMRARSGGKRGLETYYSILVELKTKELELMSKLGIRGESVKITLPRYELMVDEEGKAFFVLPEHINKIEEKTSHTTLVPVGISVTPVYILYQDGGEVKPGLMMLLSGSDPDEKLNFEEYKENLEELKKETEESSDSRREFVKNIDNAIERIEEIQEKLGKKDGIVRDLRSVADELCGGKLDEKLEGIIHKFNEMTTEDLGNSTAVAEKLREGKILSFVPDSKKAWTLEKGRKNKWENNADLITKYIPRAHYIINDLLRPKGIGWSVKGDKVKIEHPYTGLKKYKRTDIKGVFGLLRNNAGKINALEIRIESYGKVKLGELDEKVNGKLDELGLRGEISKYGITRLGIMLDPRYLGVPPGGRDHDGGPDGRQPDYKVRHEDGDELHRALALPTIR
ncbi:MAG: hypothetical protein GWN64_10760 [Candidatus Thorarchaeota archaeon]|nr:hypothetical protein [Candidatus Thorarchaeota archaeon]